MNRVWIVEYYEDFEGHFIAGVYGSQEKAEQFVEEQSDPQSYQIDCRDVE